MSPSPPMTDVTLLAQLIRCRAVLSGVSPNRRDTENQRLVAIARTLLNHVIAQQQDKMVACRAEFPEFTADNDD